MSAQSCLVQSHKNIYQAYLAGFRWYPVSWCCRCVTALCWCYVLAEMRKRRRCC